MSDLRVVYDCTGANLGKFTIPPGVGLAGYTTGSGGVQWSTAQLNARPGTIQIDQSPLLTTNNGLADVLDYEPGAATLADLVPWYKAAKQNYDHAVRPGQRWPAVYTSAANLTPVANEFVKAGVTGPRLWIAHWDLPIADAVSMLVNSGGPFPVIGVQVHNAGLYDVSLFRADWLDAVSRPLPKPVPKPTTAEMITAAQLILRGLS